MQSIVCDVDMITQYLQQILGYHVKFKVWLVSKPFIHAHVLFSKFFGTQREVSDFCRLFSKFTIEKIFDSPSFYQTSRLRYLPQPSPLVDNSDLGTDVS